MGKFADEIEQMLVAPAGPQGQPKAPSFAEEIESIAQAPSQGGGPFEANLLGLGRWVSENPGQAAELLSQFVLSGAGMAAGAPFGPPGMATGGALGNMGARQIVRAGRRMMGATPEEAPMGDPVEMAVDLGVGAAGNLARPLMRGFSGARGVHRIPAEEIIGGSTPANIQREIAETVSEGAASQTGSMLRRVGEIGGIGSAIAGEPAIGVAVYLTSHAAEAVHRRAAASLLQSRGFNRWIGERPGMSWREAITNLSAMSADQASRLGLGVDVREGVRLLADTLDEATFGGPAQASSATGGSIPQAAPASNPFPELFTTPQGGTVGRGRDGRFMSIEDIPTLGGN